jgi:hypothetical protein
VRGTAGIAIRPLTESFFGDFLLFQAAGGLLGPEDQKCAHCQKNESKRGHHLIVENFKAENKVKGDAYQKEGKKGGVGVG